jgi:cyclohexa-1,5-dienecarbonyl-CoA hydratase
MNDTWVNHDISADGAVHTITIDRPPGNVIDIALCGQLRPAIQKAAASADGKVLVIRGAGRHFCFGASVEEHLPETAAEMLAAFGAVIRDLVGFPYPTVAAVQGRCLGGGLELALACGILIAEEGAVLASPEIRLGVLAPAAAALLPRRATEEVLLTGRDLTAVEALSLGILNSVVPDGRLDNAVDGYVDEHFVPRSTSSLRLATGLVRRLNGRRVGERLAEAERTYVEDLLSTHDGVEGIRAFMAKRPPQWRNC